MSQEAHKAAFVTFYSFKGGVGRSMALINTAGILAGRGFRVLVIDLDLEAPGLSYLNPDVPDSRDTEPNSTAPPQQLGFVDLLNDAKDRGQEADLFALSPEQLAQRYTRHYRLPPGLGTSNRGSLQIMPAGRFDGQYTQRLDSLGLHQLYQEGLGEPLMRTFKKKFAEAQLFDYVLVDSRTGFSDEAGICTRDLADYLMILSGLNHQNVEGTSTFLKALRSATNGKKAFQIVLSPVPNGEDMLLERCEERAHKLFEEAWGSQISLRLQVPYHPQLALTEEPHIFRRRRGYLFEAYQEIERSLLRALGHDSATLSDQITCLLESGEFEPALVALRRIALVDGGLGAVHNLADHLPYGLRRSSASPSTENRKQFTLDDLLQNEGGFKIAEFLTEKQPLSGFRSTRGFWFHALQARKQYGLMDRFYERLVAHSPKDAELRDSYARFLRGSLQDMDRAEHHFKAAIEVDPKPSSRVVHYAWFLSNSRNDAQAAGIQFKRAVEIESTNSFALRSYAIFLGNEPEAEVYYKQAIEQDPKDATCFTYYADFLSQRGDLYDAERFFKQAVDADPKSAFSLWRYAIFLDTRKADTEAADHAFQQAIKADPKNAYYLGHYALFLQNKRHDIDEAGRCFNEAIEADPNHAYNLGNYALFLLTHRNDVDGADHYFKRAVQANPKLTYHVNNYAFFLENRRADFDAAEAMFRQAIDTANEKAYCHRNYARFLQRRRGDLDAAEAGYQKAIELAPTDPLYSSDYASFLTSHRKDFFKADVYHKRTIELAPTDANYLEAYAIFLEYQREDVSEAERYYVQAIEANPKSAVCLGNYALFLLKRGKSIERAEEFFKRALEADPLYTHALENYGNFLLNQRRNKDAAGEMFKRAVESAPKNVRLIGNYANFLHRQQGDLAGASAYYARGIAIDSRNAGFQSFYGQVLALQGKWPGALQVLRAAVDLFEPSARAGQPDLFFCNWLVDRIIGLNADRLERHLKFFIIHGFKRYDWDFERMVEKGKENLSAEGFAYAMALARAFVSESTVDDLDHFEKWRALEPLDPRDSNVRISDTTMPSSIPPVPAG